MHQQVDKQSNKLLLSCLLYLLSTCLCPSITEAAVIPKDKIKINVPEACKHQNETVAAGKLNQICEDCYDLFKNDDLKALCNDACFISVYFTACLKAVCMWDEKDTYKEMVEKLSGYKFGIWHYDHVQLEGNYYAKPPTVEHSIQTRSTLDYCKAK